MNLSSLKRKSFKDYVDLRWYFQKHFRYPVDWACSKDSRREFLVRIATDVMKYVFFQNTAGQFLKAEVYWGRLFLTTAYFSNLDELPNKFEDAASEAISEACRLLYSCDSDDWCDGSEFMYRKPDRYKIVTID